MKKNISISLVIILLIGLTYYLININASPSFIGTWEDATYYFKNKTWEIDTTQSTSNYIVSNKQIIIITESRSIDTMAWKNVPRENIKNWLTEQKQNEDDNELTLLTGIDEIAWDENFWIHSADSIAKIATNKQIDGWVILKNLDDSPIFLELLALPFPYVWTGKNELTLLMDDDEKVVMRRTK